MQPKTQPKSGPQSDPTKRYAGNGAYENKPDAPTPDQQREARRMQTDAAQRRAEVKQTRADDRKRIAAHDRSKP